MANSAQSKKRAIQSEKRRQHNASRRSMMRTYMKKFLSSLDSGDKNLIEMSFREATSVLDRMVKTGIIHKNKAARHKSRFSAKIKALNIA